MYIRINNMTWPYPDNELEWKARYGNPTRVELYQMASIISAYRQMIRDTRGKRQIVIRKIRAALTERPVLLVPQKDE
jgi:hypothetical protein